MKKLVIYNEQKLRFYDFCVNLINLEKFEHQSS